MTVYEFLNQVRGNLDTDEAALEGFKIAVEEEQNDEVCQSFSDWQEAYNLFLASY